MKLDEYQKLTLRTAGDISLPILGLGVAGEAGEVADIIKKVEGHGHELDPAKLGKELGDVLWYVAVTAHKIGIPLSEVASGNIEKLKKRYPEGFSEERSRNRPGEK